MPICVIVFDFDGTLVDSNAMKHEAFFRLFPDNAVFKSVVEGALKDQPEASRYAILQTILDTLKRQGVINGKALEVARLAEEYNRIVEDGAKRCPAMPGAEAALRNLCEKYPLYLSSTTPEKFLKRIVQHRQWQQYFKKVFGYPNLKNDNMKTILSLENVRPEAVLLVGDGDSDRAVAAATGCQFANVDETSSLTIFFKQLSLL